MSSNWFRTRLRGIVPVALAALLAAACGSSGSGSSSAVGYGTSQPKTKISFWYMPNGAAPADYFKAEAAAFNKAHPNIEVDGTLVDWSDAFSKVTTAVTSGVGPDVTQLGTTWVGAFSRTGGLHDFSQAEIAGLGGKSAFFPASWSTSSLVGSGQTTAIPWFVDTRAIYYRSDVLKNLGIEPTTAFQDWNSLDQTLAKIKAAGQIQPLGLPGKNDNNVVHNFAPWIWGAGGDFVNADGTRATIADSAAVEGVNEYQQLAAKYVDPAVLQKNSNTVEAMFAQGSFAVTVSGPWLAQEIQTPKAQGGYSDGPAAKNGFGTASFPAGPKAHAVFFGGSNLAILKSSKHEQAAYEWVRWLTGDQGQTSYVPKVGLMPARTSAANAGVFSSSPYLLAFKNQLQYGRSYPMIAAWGPIETALVKDMGAVWDGVAQNNGPVPRGTIQGLMDQANKDVTAAIQQSQ